jgi:hypothetical protein
MSRSLGDFVHLAPDAFVLAPAAPFVPEQTKLGEYTFLPWVRSGLAAAANDPVGAALRATATVHVTVQGEGRPDQIVDKTITLRGPGDVLGINPGEIVRRMPAPNAYNVEESFLAHIEFNRPELPWLFSPAAPHGDQLRPWLALVVCAVERASIQPGPTGFPQQLVTHMSELQPLGDAWAWAHAQVTGPLDGTPSLDDRLTDDYALTNLSRILCPRRLDKDKSYIACLVPSYDCGVKTGLGSSEPGRLDPAWTRAANDGDKQITLPVYDSWRFSVAEAGDFGLLAQKLVPIKAPWQVGRRMIDASKSDSKLMLPDDAPGAIQTLRCALVSPAPPDDPALEASAWPAPTREVLRSVIDTRQGDPKLPRVGPRVYAQYQRAQRMIGNVFVPPTSVAAAEQDWFADLNTSPVHRIVAGLGTRVVQKDREPLMQAAWQQVGDINAVNRVLTRIQFGRFLGQAVLDKHFATLGLGELAQAMRGLQGKIRVSGSALTVNGLVARSRVPPAAMTGAFRRAARSRGPVARIAGNAAALRQLVAVAGTFKDMRLTYVEPDGISSLSSSGIAALSIEVVAKRFGTQATRQTAAQRLARVPGAVNAADRLLAPPASWRVPTGTIDLASLAAAQIQQGIDAAPTRLAADGARQEAVAPLLVGIANGATGATAERARLGVQQINERLAFAPAAVGLVVPNIGHVGGPNLGDTIRINRAVIAGRAAAGTPGANVHLTAPVELGAGAALTPGAVAAAPDALHRFENSTSRTLTGAMVNARSVPFNTIAAALAQFAQGTGVASMKPTPDRAALNLSRAALLDAVAPARTATTYAKWRLKNIPDWLPKDWFDDGMITPIMAAPHFDRPMYQALDDYNRDWLVPGLGTIDKTDFVTVLFTNPVFTEAFLVGLSDEMGRELLWRDYPTDQRGTYFRRFWDEAADELTADIHRFKPTPLGSHIARGGGATEGRLVLVMRGELFRRYPDAIVVAVRENTENGTRLFADPPAPGQEGAILFHAHLDPNFRLVGFNLTETQARNEPWWFLVAEHPTAPRFGLGLEAAQTGALRRNAMQWQDLRPLAFERFLTPSAPGHPVSISDPDSNPPSTTWPGNAAIVARTLLHDPVRAAFDAKSMIKTS